VQILFCSSIVKVRNKIFIKNGIMKKNRALLIIAVSTIVSASVYGQTPQPTNTINPGTYPNNGITPPNNPINPTTPITPPNNPITPPNNTLTPPPNNNNPQTTPYYQQNNINPQRNDTVPKHSMGLDTAKSFPPKKLR
jgi:hypothetical protein